MTEPRPAPTAADRGCAVLTWGLTKRFGDRVAVDALDLAIPFGSVCGFVGPNGAGKTTTIRMLLGLVRPSSGDGTVLGQPITDPAAYLPRVGALIESPAHYPSMTGRANLLALARLGHLDPIVVDRALERVGLRERADDTFRSYSLGMKQRLGIAAALLPDPQLVVLDEPVNGLDPAGILETRTLIRSLADDGITVFVSSHLLAEIEQVCDHLVMIQGGRLVYQGSVDDLAGDRGVQLVARPEEAAQVDLVFAVVRSTGRHAEIVGDEVVVEAEPGWAGDLNRLAMGMGVTLVHLTERRRSLEDAFLELTGSASTSTRLGEVGQ